MDLDANVLLVSLLVGTLGGGIFIYGKKQARAPHLVGGIAMMAYPYFVTNVFLSLGIAVVLLLAIWGATKMGL